MAFNALKYFTVIIPPLISIYLGSRLFEPNYQVWLVFKIIATIYVTVWDWIVDWGMFTCFEKGKFCLRKQFLFPRWFYYFAIFENFVFRFWWLIGFIEYGFVGDQENFFQQLQVLVFFNLLAEAVRRTIWAIIRIENEFFNNYENYRTLTKIPSLMGKIGTLDKAELIKLRSDYHG